MNLKYLLLLVLMAMPLAAKDVPAKNDKMIDTIKRIDPKNLNQLLIPGFFIRNDEKKRYLEVAREMTNRTYKELHSYSWGDFVRFFKGTTKIGIGVGGAAAAYLYYRGDWDISLWNAVPKNREIIAQDLPEKTYRAVVYGVLGLLSSSLLYSGLGNFSDILDKKDRLIRHRDALAVEAVIQRLPVCEIDPPETKEIQ